MQDNVLGSQLDPLGVARGALMAQERASLVPAHNGLGS